jgi:hypothetical protein
MNLEEKWNHTLIHVVGHGFLYPFHVLVKLSYRIEGGGRVAPEEPGNEGSGFILF